MPHTHGAYFHSVCSCGRALSRRFRNNSGVLSIRSRLSIHNRMPAKASDHLIVWLIYRHAWLGPNAISFCNIVTSHENVLCRHTTHAHNNNQNRRNAYRQKKMRARSLSAAPSTPTFIEASHRRFRTSHPTVILLLVLAPLPLCVYRCYITRNLKKQPMKGRTHFVCAIIKFRRGVCARDSNRHAQI